MSLSGFSPKTWVPVPDPEAVLRAAVEANCSIMFCVPSLLEVRPGPIDKVIAWADEEKRDGLQHSRVSMG